MSPMLRKSGELEKKEEKEVESEKIMFEVVKPGSQEIL